MRYLQKSLQNLRNTSNSTLEKYISSVHEDDDFDDDNDDHEENTNSAEHIDEDDSDEDDDENQFYYKTPGKQYQPSNGGVKTKHKPIANGVEKKLHQNGGTKFESSLMRYILPQNTLSPLALNFDSISAASFQSGITLVKKFKLKLKIFYRYS